MALSLPVASTTSSHPYGLLQDVGGGRRVRAAQLPGHREPVRVDVDDVDAHRADAFGQLEHHQAHRAGAIDQHV